LHIDQSKNTGPIDSYCTGIRQEERRQNDDIAGVDTIRQ
jgi:hypothetical protein